MFRHRPADNEIDETEDDEFDESDDDESDDDDELPEEEEDDDDPPEEYDAMLALLDKTFRALRARIRRSTDLSELREIRADHEATLSVRLSPPVRLRTLDIIELIDDRVTDLRASRGGSRLI